MGRKRKPSSKRQTLSNILTNAVAVAAVGVFAIGAFAADRFKCNNNDVLPTDGASRARLRAEVGLQLIAAVLQTPTARARRAFMHASMRCERGTSLRSRQPKTTVERSTLTADHAGYAVSNRQCKLVDALFSKAGIVRDWRETCAEDAGKDAQDDPIAARKAHADGGDPGQADVP